MLRASAGDVERRELDTIIHEAHRLSRTLENLLAITDTGRAVQREWIPIEELVGAVLARLETSLAERAVTVDVPDNLLAHVDPVLGELLLANLLDNAARHSPPGTPLELRARRERAAVILEVADRGVELPPRPHGIEHTRADELALAACRRIAGMYGGTLELSKRDGGGTVFLVHLPDGEPLPKLDDLATGGV